MSQERPAAGRELVARGVAYGAMETPNGLCAFCTGTVPLIPICGRK